LCTLSFGEQQKAIAAELGISPATLCTLCRHALERLGIQKPLLTAAESEIAQMLIDGLDRRRIAQERGTSARTVAYQIHSVFLKAAATGRYPLLRKVLERQWNERGAARTVHPPRVVGVGSIIRLISDAVPDRSIFV
jgi:DNA-binding CsgD family transcriptional regulator